MLLSPAAATTSAAVKKFNYKLYGVPLSQPFRSVAWTMLQLQLPFKIELAVPGLNNKIGTKHNNFRSLTSYRNANIPILSIQQIMDGNNNNNNNNNDNNVVVLSESPAIMMYLCELSSSSKLYPYPTTSNDVSSLLIQKAKIDSYLHWHHDNTRLLSKLFQVKIRTDMTNEIRGNLRKKIDDLLYNINNGWLANDENKLFIGGMDKPTIADILMYGEISTVTMTNLLDIDPMKYHNIYNWTQRMSKLPYHDVVHAALYELGDLNIPTQPIPKLLSNATKVGLKSLTDAQQSFTSKL